MSICAFIAKHTPCPSGYIEWHAWARRMGRTHRQIRCEGCGLLTIWVPRKRRLASLVGAGR